MANTQTTVPAFVASQVLTAAEMTQSASTGVPVFATTVTRDAGFGGSGQKALAQGQLCYLEATDVVQYYDGSAWATLAPAAPAAASALTYITSATLSSSSTTITNCFSATYENYLILCNSISGGTNGSSIHARFGISGTPTTADYLYASGDGTYSSQAQYPVGQFGNGPAGSFIVTVLAPQLATQTFFSYQANSTYNGIGNSIIQTGYQNSSSQFTDFVVIAAGGTFSGGTVRVYGYSNS